MELLNCVSPNTNTEVVQDLYAAVTSTARLPVPPEVKPYSVNDTPRKRTRTATNNAKIDKTNKPIVIKTNSGVEKKKVVQFIEENKNQPTISNDIDHGHSSIPSNITMDTSNLNTKIKNNNNKLLFTQPYVNTAQTIATITTPTQDNDYEMATVTQPPNAPKMVNRRRANSVPNVGYNVIDDILSSKANIDFRDLFIAAPTIKRDFMSACRTLPRLKGSIQAQVKNQSQLKVNDLVSSVNINTSTVPLNFIEDGDIDTTAMHATIYINNQPIPSIIDSGSAKTCMSKEIADRLGLTIDAPSTSVFRMGNGNVQPALGLIYDTPINPGGQLIIPGSVEVLPKCPGNLIIGNNWLHRAKSVINYETKTVTVKYKNSRTTFPVIYDKAEFMTKFKIRSVINQHYEIEQDNSMPSKQLSNSQIGQTSVNEIYDNDSEEDLSTDEEPLENDEIPMYEDENDSDDQNMYYMDDLFYLENDILPSTNTISSHPHDDDHNVLQVFTTSQITIAPYATVSFNITGHLLSHFPDHSNDSRYIFTIMNPTFSDCSISHVLDVHNTIQLTNPSNENLILGTNIFLGEAERYDNTTIDSCFLFEIDERETHELYNINSIQSNECNNTENSKTTSEEPELSSELQEKLDLSNVPDSAKSDLLKLLYKYRDIFDWHNDRIGCINVAEYSIKLKENAVPYKATPYRLSPLETEHLQTELDKLLRLGVIKECPYSDWAAPIMMVKKKDGSYRLVVDLRKCNSQIIRTMHPIPRIDDLIDILGKSKIFSQFDLRSSFFQVPLAEDSQPIASFITKLGHYMFCRLPQGLSSSPNFFMYIMEPCFKPLINKILVIYLDDLTSFSNENPQNHLDNLEQIFSCIKKSGMLLNPTKTHLFTKEIPFLGVIITADGVRTDPRLVSKVKDFPVPGSLKTLRQFCGLTSYYRRFIQSYAAIARPLYELMKKENVKFVMSTKGEEAFNILKQKLIEAPILMIADFSKPFVVVTDASILGFGEVLSQKDEKGRDHPVIYSSRSLKETERNWGISKLELGAVVWALELYRPYILGSQFTVEILTDNSGAVGLINTKSPKGIIARWIQQLSEYNFTIKFRPGKTNGNADFLSRLGH